MPVFRLTEELIFPSPFLAEDDGILAIGGDLSVERLLLAYQNGIFPWYSDDEPIIWHAPNPRFVLFPEKIKISKSLKQLINKEVYTITFNTSFNEVIENCSNIARTGQDGTWITSEMKQAYINLHKAGYATSVEVWSGNKLAGGLYGVQINNVFFGESMFHLEPNTSKIALAFLAKMMNFKLIDCQVHTSHLESLGAEYISLAEFLKIIQQP